MDVSLKVTDQPQESSFFDLVSGDSVLSIPLFQRSYRWGQRNLDWLWDDIIEIQDDLSKSTFLGVVVCVSRNASPGRAIPWEIVDGQQRLSTLYMLLLAAVEVAARNDAHTWASGVLGTYLLVRPLADNPVNTKLVPSFADRLQFRRIWDGILNIPGFAEEPSVAANPPRPPVPSGEETGPLLTQYNRIRKKLMKLWDTKGQESVAKVVEISAQRLSVVSISLRDPIVAPKIFERLNNRAELVSTADLVRNEVFARASDDPTQAQYVFANFWEPFVARFSVADNGMEKFLFPYGLILRHTVTKAELFSQIRSHWESLQNPQAIIADMTKYIDAFLVLEANVTINHFSQQLQTSLSRIHRLNKPSSTYAFILRLVAGIDSGEVSEQVAIDVLKVIEDFLFRRAICGIEPTGLHAVFKGLWPDLMTVEYPPGVSAEATRAIISSKTTVAWPNNAEFEAAIRSGNLYARKVVKFALAEFEVSCHGESPSDDFEIEHILPQTMTEQWSAAFPSQHAALVNTWANLLPITNRMNPSIGQSSFSEKRDEYTNSIFASTRECAQDYSDWTPASLAQRASELVEWSLTRWPTNRVT